MYIIPRQPALAPGDDTRAAQGGDAGEEEVHKVLSALHQAGEVDNTAGRGKKRAQVRRDIYIFSLI